MKKLKQIKEYITPTKHEKKYGVKDKIKSGLSYISRIISASIFQPIVEGAKRFMNDIEDRIIQTEKRMLRSVSSLLIIGFGLVFLILALFFFLKESLGWNNAAAFFSIGITAFVAGLLLKIRGYDK
jgi:hypothetical protein